MYINRKANVAFTSTLTLQNITEIFWRKYKNVLTIKFGRHLMNEPRYRYQTGPETNGPSNETWLIFILTIFIAGSLLQFLVIFNEYRVLSNTPKNDRSRLDQERLDFLIFLVLGIAFTAIAYILQLYLFSQGKEIVIRLDSNTVAVIEE
jgi:hypothetical protein